MAAPTMYSPQSIEFYKKLQAQKQTPPPVGLPAGLLASFAQQKLAANNSYKTGLADNKYQQSVARDTYANRLRDLTFQWDKTREAMPYGALRRGILGSGIWRHNIGDYGQQRLRSIGDFYRERSAGMGRFDLLRQQLERERASALAQIEAQRQAAIAQQALQPFGGQ